MVRRIGASVDDQGAITADVVRVLGAMREGVIAVDASRQITVINRAACAILGFVEGNYRGKPFSTVIENRECRELLEKLFLTGDPVEIDLTLDNSSRVVGTYGRLLHEGQGTVVGALIRLNDVTQLRRLERVRQDFVANVSHELKTPVTSIKGFVETLLDGAVNDPTNAKRFLEIVSRQVDRLSAIMADLLLLSTVDDDSRRADISFEAANVSDSARSAIEVCSLRAKEKDVRLELIVEGDTIAVINQSLLEQAISNLVANAIYYSNPQSTVTIVVSREGLSVVVRVIDRGCGIAPEHLPRLFERFYRVDKSRARKAGGTGLGLAIVKHIAQVHGGHASAQSEFGKGSTFSIVVPGATPVSEGVVFKSTKRS